MGSTEGLLRGLIHVVRVVGGPKALPGGLSHAEGDELSMEQTRGGEDVAVNNPSEWIVFSERIEDQKKAEQGRTTDPWTNSTETFWCPPWAEWHSHETTKNQTRPQSQHRYFGSINIRTSDASDQSTQEVRKITPTSSRSRGSQKNGSRYPRSTQEVRKMTHVSSHSGERSQKNDSYLKPLGEKSEKWLQKFPLNAGSQKNDSCLKPLRGSQKNDFRNLRSTQEPLGGKSKNDFRNPRSTQEVRIMTPASSRSKGSQKNGFRNPRSMQEVRKMTLVSSLLGEVRKMASKIPVQHRKTLEIPAQQRELENNLLPQAAREEVRKSISEIPAQCRKFEKELLSIDYSTDSALSSQQPIGVDCVLGKD
ncbi:hypothetical protein V8G54_007422 [Vigna mungo]|uniref:Uncharacterized protein n=1 Tax=Vigna mungo TaxID=3915 RepID=A0AAQ3P1Q4_VIGMU